MLTPKKYIPGKIDSECAYKYSKRGIEGTGKLAVQEIPKLIKEYWTGSLALDYGCGAGRSTLFLKDNGLSPVGVDISRNMLRHTQNIKEIQFLRIESAKLPFPDSIFNFAYSCLVMPEIKTLFAMGEIFKEIFRVLKSNGVFIVVTTSEELYYHEWVSLKVNYPQNTNLKSGDKAKILLCNSNLEIEDYFWTLQDFKNVSSAANFEMLKTIHPLAQETCAGEWKSETTVSPYSVMVFGKS